MNKANCLVCAKPLQYYDPPILKECIYCKQQCETNSSCVDGHYVCDECHARDAYQLIYQACLNTSTTGPLELANTLMKHEAMKMHGPEYHFLVPAVIISCYMAVANPNVDRNDLKESLDKALKRSKNLIGGSCSFHGNCAAGVGAGIAMSVLTPLSRKEWQLSNLATARALLSISNYEGPRCCKRNTFLAIKSVTKHIEGKLEVKLLKSAPRVCEFYQHDALNKSTSLC